MTANLQIVIAAALQICANFWLIVVLAVAGIVAEVRHG